MLEFQLFSVKVYPSRQGLLFKKPKKPPEILQETICSVPSTEIRKGMIWHIGNISKIDNDGLYFRVGKTTKARREVYHNGNFDDEEFEEAPYTHVLLDIVLEVCAIAKKTKLSPTPSGIANRLIQLLNESATAKDYAAEFEIDRINDPKDLITHLRQAHVISKFWMTFARPNPFYASDFIKPFSDLLKQTQGEKGKAEIEGKDLKSGPLEELARSAATTGNDATAWLQLKKEGQRTIMHLKKNPVFLQQEDVADDEQKRTLLRRLRDLYAKIRGSSNNES